MMFPPMSRKQSTVTSWNWAQSWADQNEALVVRISQVESRLLGITGILDIANTKINGEAANCTLTLDHIPVLGTIEPGTIVING